MKYLSIAQTAERWGISTRRIQILCGEGRVPGAIRIGTVWGIPEDAEKPADARIKNGKYIKKPPPKTKNEPHHISDSNSKIGHTFPLAGANGRTDPLVTNLPKSSIRQTMTALDKKLVLPRQDRSFTTITAIWT